MLYINGKPYAFMPKAMPKLGICRATPPSNGSFWSTPKLDGHCLFLEKLAPNASVAYTRTGEVYTEHLYRSSSTWFKDFERLAPVGTCLAGELYSEGFTSTDVIRRLVNNSPLDFRVFAVPSIAYLAPMEEATAVALACGQEFIQWEKHPKYSLGLLQGLYDAQNPKTEGVVVRWGQLYLLRKWKPVKTITLFVTRIEEGEGRLKGTAGALICSACIGSHVVEVCKVGTGLTDPVRASFWSVRQAIAVGQHTPIVEIAYDCVTKNSLRFPRYMRTRDSVEHSIQQCTLEQEPSLLESLRPC